MRKQQHFHAHEMARMDALDGLPLATFWQRALGYFIDIWVAVLLWAPTTVAWMYFVQHKRDFRDLKFNFHEPSNLVVMVLYWGACNYFWNGRTVGKWIARTRAVSLTSERMGRWQSVERGLGYGAAILEGGLGMLQYFWDRNHQCVQDRIAETIVVDTRKKAKPPGSFPQARKTPVS